MCRQHYWEWWMPLLVEKTGINTLHGKNSVGLFSQPKAIFMDLNFLKTLPDPEYLTAFSEIIKHALIADVQYFHFILGHASQLKRKDNEPLLHVIKRSCEIKSKHCNH